MSKPAARIQSGDRFYDLYSDGKISQVGQPPSGDWACTGAVEFNNFGHVIRRFSLAEVLQGNVPWKYKNGKQRACLLDLDHGTRRCWRSPPHSVYPL